MPMILAPSNLIANVLHTPAQVPHFRSLLASSGCPITRDHSYLNPMLQPENTRYPVRKATEKTNGGVKATASKVRQYHTGTWPGCFSSDLSSKYQVSIYCAKFCSTQASPNHLTRIHLFTTCTPTVIVHTSLLKDTCHLPHLLAPPPATSGNMDNRMTR